MNLSDYPDVIRLVNMLLCTAAAGGLLWRLIGRWMISWALAKWVVSLFAALEFLVAIGTAYRAAAGGPFNPVQYIITIHAILTLAIIAIWPQISNTKPIQH